MISAWIPSVLEVIAKCGPVVECDVSINGEYRITPGTQKSVV